MDSNPLNWQIGVDKKPTQDLIKKQKEKQYQSDLLYWEVFGTEKGRKLLAILRENTIESSAWSPALAASKGMEAANAHAYSREGQNALVRTIELGVKRIDSAKDFDDYFNKF